MVGRITRRRRVAAYAGAVLAGLVLAYLAFSALGLWGPLGDPFTYRTRQRQRQQRLSEAYVRATLEHLIWYHERVGSFPPDDAPYRWDAENLHYYLNVRLGITRGWMVPPTAPSPWTASRAVRVDAYGNPIRFRSPSRALSRPLPDVWTAGRDHTDGTADDIASWAMPHELRLCRRWLAEAEGGRGGGAGTSSEGPRPPIPPERPLSRPTD